MITVQDLDNWRDEQLTEIRELEALADLKELKIEGEHGKESGPQDHPED